MILVLGGNGFIGYNLVKRFTKKDKIRVLDRKWIHEKDNPQIEYVTGDFCHMNFEELLEGVQVVFHLISTSVPYDGTERMIQNIEEILLPTVRFLNVMRKKNVKEIYFISSGGAVYGECQSPSKENDRLSPECIYAVEKVWIEMCLHLFEKYDSIKGYVLRVGNPYGLEINKEKGQGIIPIFAEKIMKGDYIEIWGTGENRRDYIYIDEVIDAIEAVYSYSGECRIFNIGTGSSYSIMDIIQYIECIVGKKAQIIYKEKRKCDILESCMDVSLIQDECGWSSHITIEQGIMIYIGKIMRH